MKLVYALSAVEGDRVLKSIAGEVEIPAMLKNESCDNIQLYFHGAKPSVSPYRSIAVLTGFRNIPESKPEEEVREEEGYSDHPAE